MINFLFPWQDKIWGELQKVFTRLPHAILFHGAQGIGKTEFVEYFAKSLLCEKPKKKGYSCNFCSSCMWFIENNHPDYRQVHPENYSIDKDPLNHNKIENKENHRGGLGTLSDQIKIDQIRALSSFVNISAHRRGKKIVLLYPAEAMNISAANALLKTLEEPPADTVFLLITDSLDCLPLTISSRCYKFPMPFPSYEQAILWLRNDKEVKDAEIWLSEQGGAPLSAFKQSKNNSRKKINKLLQYLADPGVENALECAEYLHNISIKKLADFQQRWLYDLFFFKLSGKIRYYPSYEKSFILLTNRVKVSALLLALKNSNEQRESLKYSLSARLFIEVMLLDYAAIFDQER